MDNSAGVANRAAARIKASMLCNMEGPGLEAVVDKVLAQDQRLGPDSPKKAGKFQSLVAVGYCFFFLSFSILVAALFQTQAVSCLA